MIARVMLAAIFAIGIAAAQDPGEGGGGGGGMGGGGGRGGGGGGDMGGGGGGMGMARRQTKAEILFDKLKLNKEQKEDGATVLQAANEKAATLREQLSKGRAMIANAMMAKQSEAELKKLNDGFVQVNTMMTQIEAEAFGKLYALLKPNQQAKAPQAFELMAGLFSGVVAGPGGRGRGGMGGPGRGQGGGR
ncbi:MAG: hypothetical protein ABI759_30790 [Candidatus Solibacter sp.]